jgi:hypothetical protein
MESHMKEWIGFIIATITAFVATSYYVGEMNKKYLIDNWSSLRCNPIYMPLAGYIGQDTFGNFTSCVTSSFQTYAGLSMDGMNSQMSLVSETLGSIGSSMSDMRGMMGSTRGGFMMVFQMVFGKIANLMGSMQYLMIRIQTLMGRIVGVFASLIYAFYAGAQTGQAVWNGPIGETVRIL